MTQQLSFWQEPQEQVPPVPRKKQGKQLAVTPPESDRDQQTVAVLLAENEELKAQNRLLCLLTAKAESVPNALQIENEELKEQNHLLWIRIRDDRRSEILIAEIYRQVIEENAVGIWFALCNGTIPFQRDSTIYEIVAGDMKTRTFIARLEAGYEEICLSEKECSELHATACQQVIAHYTTVIQDKKAQLEASTDAEEDETEGMKSAPKREKVSVRDLKERIAVLEVRAMLPLPEQLKNLLENDRYASYRIRSLEFSLRESEHYLLRQHRRIEELEGHPIEWKGPHPAPLCACRHCGKRVWQWKGHGYECGECWLLSTEIENTCVALREENQQLRERLAELEGRPGA